MSMKGECVATYVPRRNHKAKEVSYESVTTFQQIPPHAPASPTELSAMMAVKIPPLLRRQSHSHKSRRVRSSYPHIRTISASQVSIPPTLA